MDSDTTGALDAPKPKRRRNPEASRAAILDAARQVFTERGYSGGSIREIARRAGVTHGLVMRHFGSKERLLVLALPGVRDLATLLPGPLETLPERIAQTFVSQTESPEGDSTLIALIRSAASGDDAALPLYAELDQQSGAAYRAVLGDGADAYIDLLRSLLIGVTFTRHVVKTSLIAAMSTQELTDYLVPAIRAILLPVLAPAADQAPHST